MQKRNIANLLGVVIACAAMELGGNGALAGVIYDYPETWTEAGLRGWAAYWGNASVSLVNPGDYLRISFAEIDAPLPDLVKEIVRTDAAPATSMFVGNYRDTGIGWTTFKFLAEDVEPGFAQLRWTSGTHTWRYSLDGIDIGWNTFKITFDYDAGWIGGPGWNNEDQFLTDLAAVDWIGIYISRGGADITMAQNYGLDSFQLFVPEPGQINMLCAAGLALLLTLRRKRAAA